MRLPASGKRTHASGAPSGAFQGIELKFSAPLQNTQAELCPQPHARPVPCGEQGWSPSCPVLQCWARPSESFPQCCHTPEGPRAWLTPQRPREAGGGALLGLKNHSEVAGGPLLASPPGARFISTLAAPQKPSLSGVSQAAGHSQLRDPDLRKTPGPEPPGKGDTGPDQGSQAAPKLGAHFVGWPRGASEGTWAGGGGLERDRKYPPFPIPPGLQNKLLELNSERCR